jgi:hypothetical protein
MCRFHRPHAPLQPLEQRHVIGCATKERLAQVHVGLDESWKEVAAAGVDDSFAAGPRRTYPNRNDASVPDRHVTLDDVEAIIHRDNRRVLDDDGT